MTRINLVDPKTLTTKHLVAEYRELPRIFGLVTKRLEKNQPFNDIPAEYTMGSGHVKFFYDKLEFLQNRFLSIVDEMRSRGYVVRYSNTPSIDHYPFHLKKDYIPTKKALEISASRIAERLKSTKRKSFTS